eukprot:SAG31_NODE_713_length_12651_cov_180.009481_2_plen_209_part_00
MLLRNDRQTLPLQQPLSSLALLGPNANSTSALLSDYNGCSGRFNKDFPHFNAGCELTTPLSGFQAALRGTGTTIQYAEGCSRDGRNESSSDADASIKAAAALAASADAAVVVLGLVSAGDDPKDSLEGETRDRDSLTLPGAQLQLVRAVMASQRRTVLVLISGSMIRYISFLLFFFSSFLLFFFSSFLTSFSHIFLCYSLAMGSANRP